LTYYIVHTKIFQGSREQDTSMKTY